MSKLIGKEINTSLGAQTILIWALEFLLPRAQITLTIHDNNRASFRDFGSYRIDSKNGFIELASIAFAAIQTIDVDDLDKNSKL